MKSYSCHEGDIQSIDGKNTIELDSFQQVKPTKANTENAKIDILVPLSPIEQVYRILQPLLWPKENLCPKT
jgi:hypothetical protein